jgi:hypothetical protein
MVSPNLVLKAEVVCLICQTNTILICVVDPIGRLACLNTGNAAHAITFVKEYAGSKNLD